jgi:hypothetical protein
MQHFLSATRTSVRVVLSTNQKGAIPEAHITAEAIRRGIVVWRPVAEGCRYDMILDVDGRLLRTQCKWGSRMGDVIVVRIRTCRHTPRGSVKTTYTADEIDGVAVWCEETRDCYFIRSPMCQVRASSLCVSRPRGTTRNSLYTGPRITALGL